MEEKDWKKELSPEQYKILREKGTDVPFEGKYIHHHEDGMYVCAACGNALFDSDTKFDSGSGWPSFYDVAVDGNIALRQDTSVGLERTEVVCSKCGGHLGHLFDDGPQDKGGKRYCINSTSLDFTEK